MPNDARELHIDAALSNMSQRYNPGGFIADKVAPIVAVKKISDKIKVYDSTHLKRIDTLRKDKTDSKLIEWGFGTDDSYLLDGHAVHGYVSPADEENADAPIKPYVDEVETQSDILLLDREYRVKTLVCTAGSYGANNKQTLSGTSQWSDYSSGNSDPIGVIKDAQAAIKASSGKEANFIAFDYKVGLTLSHHPDIVDLIKYTNPTLLTRSGLPPVLFGLEVVESGAILDSTAKGQTMTLGSVWGTFCLIGFSQPAPYIKSISLALTFAKGLRQVTKDWDYKKKAYYVETSEPDMDEKLITANCGYLVTAAIA